MKKIFLILILVFAAGLVTVSCKKDDPGSTGEVDADHDLFALTDNGKQHTITRLIKRDQEGYIAMGAPVSFSSGYALAIADSLEEGTYELVPDAPVQLTKTIATGKQTFTQTSGTLTIISHDRAEQRISGSFSGLLVNQMNGETATITDGQFVCNYGE